VNDLPRDPEHDPNEPDRPDDSAGDTPRGEPGPIDPMAAMFGAMDPSQLGAIFQQLGRALSSDETGPVNWDLARDMARQTVSAKGDASVTESEQHAVADAIQLADHWLDAVTSIPAGVKTARAWSRAEWVEGTLPAWRDLVEPVAARVAGSMDQMVPAEMRQMAGPLLGVIQRMGGAMFGGQVGQAIGELAAEVVGSTDVGLPLGPAGTAALLPANVAAFGAGLGVPPDQVRLYVALREAAHHRLFAHMPWLRAHLLGAVEAYSRGIRVDTRRLEEAVGRIDPSDPEAMQQALSGGMFEIEQTPEQEAALARLETMLALVEGWVDEVVSAAAEPHLPSAAALRETVRRRRAAGGPAEQTFATLVGLELRPRRLREAAALWHLYGEERGADARDAVWAHPDLMPTADDLDNPADYVRRADTDLTVPELGDGDSGSGGA
jgi:putative hydrolase